MRRLLLLSNSTSFGRGLLDHAAEELAGFLAPCRRVAFVPFALADRDGYAERIRARLAALDLAVDAVADGAEGHRTLLEAEAVFVGGGNTFRLLSTLQRHGLLPLLAERARAGMPYVGSSAGTNLAGPTIRTTNDMPIVEPTSLDALGLVPFQINPHYLDPDPASTHMGETREQRLREFHEENATPVLALREGAWLRVEGGRARLGGLRGARLFRRGAAPEELLPGAALDRLLEG